MKKITNILLLFLLITVIWPAKVVSAQNKGDDIVEELRITITLEDTGHMIIKYEFLNYCAGIDYPDGPYRVGVPNREFEVLDFGSPNGLVTNASPKISGSQSQVALTLEHKPKKGEYWDMTFTIRQKKMAYDNGDTGISMQFKNPYWSGQDDYLYARNLVVIWVYGEKIPSKFDPQPAINENGQASYSWKNVRMNSQFASQTLLFPREAFPNLDAANLRTEEEPFTGGEVPAVKPATSTSGSGFPWLQCFCWCLVGILIILFVWYILWAIERRRIQRQNHDTYYGTTNASTISISPVTFLEEDVSDFVDDIVDSLPDLEGGGGGGGGGGGNSCAGGGGGCACACACAGSGR